MSSQEAVQSIAMGSTMFSTAFRHFAISKQANYGWNVDGICKDFNDFCVPQQFHQAITPQTPVQQSPMTLQGFPGLMPKPQMPTPGMPFPSFGGAVNSSLAPPVTTATGKKTKSAKEAKCEWKPVTEWQGRINGGTMCCSYFPPRGGNKDNKLICCALDVINPTETDPKKWKCTFHQDNKTCIEKLLKEMGMDGGGKPTGIFPGVNIPQSQGFGGASMPQGMGVPNIPNFGAPFSQAPHMMQQQQQVQQPADNKAVRMIGLRNANANSDVDGEFILRSCWLLNLSPNAKPAVFGKFSGPVPEKHEFQAGYHDLLIELSPPEKKECTDMGIDYEFRGRQQQVTQTVIPTLPQFSQFPQQSGFPQQPLGIAPQGLPNLNSIPTLPQTGIPQQPLSQMTLPQTGIPTLPQFSQSPQQQGQQPLGLPQFNQPLQQQVPQAQQPLSQQPLGLPQFAPPQQVQQQTQGIPTLPQFAQQPQNQGMELRSGSVLPSVPTPTPQANIGTVTSETSQPLISAMNSAPQLPNLTPNPVSPPATL